MEAINFNFSRQNSLYDYTECLSVNILPYMAIKINKRPAGCVTVAFRQLMAGGHSDF